MKSIKSSKWHSPNKHILRIVLLASVAIIVVYLWSGSIPTRAAIGFVQSTSTSIAASPTTLSFTASNTAGNLIVVGVQSWNFAASVSDSRGNTYTLATSTTSAGGNLLYVFYAKNIAAGANTVTVTGPTGGNIDILEYSGLDTATPLDQVKAATGASGNPDTGAVTTAAANELIFGFAQIDANVVSGPGTGFTQRENAGNGEASEDKTVAATGSYNATFVSGASANAWAAIIATFKAAAAGGGPTRSRFIGFGIGR